MTMLAGPLDAIIILHNIETGTYHAAFFTEAPFPGPIVPVEDVMIVRLKSRMHHTEGAATLDEAREHADKLRTDTNLDAGNVFPDPVAWDGELGHVLVVQNWRKQ